MVISSILLRSPCSLLLLAEITFLINHLHQSLPPSWLSGEGLGVVTSGLPWVYLEVLVSGLVRSDGHCQRHIKDASRGFGLSTWESEAILGGRGSHLDEWAGSLAKQLCLQGWAGSDWVSALSGTKCKCHMVSGSGGWMVFSCLGLENVDEDRSSSTSMTQLCPLKKTVCYVICFLLL